MDKYKIKITIIAISEFLLACTVVIGAGWWVLSYIVSPEKEVQEKDNHRLETWVSALEWCESAGIKEAINPRDRDGTPSYYSFQFKPSTFRQYAERYQFVELGLPDGQIKALMADYELGRRIVKAMVGDNKVNFNNEFPACIKKIGMPPRD